MPCLIDTFEDDRERGLVVSDYWLRFEVTNRIDGKRTIAVTERRDFLILHRSFRHNKKAGRLDRRRLSFIRHGVDTIGQELFKSNSSERGVSSVENACTDSK